MTAHGQTSAAAEYAYIAKNLERRMCARPTVYYYDKFRITFTRALEWQPLALSEIYRGYRYGDLSLRDALLKIGTNFRNEFVIETSPRKLFLYLAFKLKSYRLLFEYLFWGYGERPGRILVWVPSVILAFAVLYYLQPGSVTHKDAWKSLWLSMGSFATMTFDVYQRELGLRIATAFEGLCGISTMGVLVAGFARRASD